MKTETASGPAYQPLYRQIKYLITESLVSGEWRPGESIPSEVELAHRYSVSQGTVRKAITESKPFAVVGPVHGEAWLGLGLDARPWPPSRIQ